MMMATSNAENPEKVYIVVKNAQGAELEPGYIVEWDNTTTTADQGYAVELVDSALSTVTGIGIHKVAGVVDSTIATGAVGILQIYGPAQVRASASLEAPLMVGAVSGGTALTIAGHADNGFGLIGAYIGHTLENGPNATNATVQLSIF
jgi:hypothetical protein